ncbi:Threonylcarbamoyl-AMP synthase [Brevinematales bacterium NS]|nr:threonylcarbamoyl-AMP synthase [Brevinematales bacterium]QJR22213.1 Threonylcarbamoyl-AMP synthase [Brevinematales bacterium NS]
METSLFPSPDEKALHFCASLLQEGRLVVFPTETVYGLGANALSEKAVQAIFEAKGRPQDNPLIVHIPDISFLSVVTEKISPEVERLFSLFSPGPLTVICERSSRIPPIVSAGLPTVGVRIPAHPLAHKLLTLAGLPVAAPSANLSGRPSPTTFEMAIRDMKGRVDAIIDGGPCEHGLESTVVMVKENKVIILRPGAITEEMLREKGFEVVLPEEKSHERPLSPGMKYTHYRPHAEVYLSHHLDEKTLEAFCKGKKTAVVGISPPVGPWERVVFPDVASYARGLFATFARLEQQGTEVIILQAVEEKGVGRALMNRMRKASGNRWIEANDETFSQ